MAIMWSVEIQQNDMSIKMICYWESNESNITHKFKICMRKTYSKVITVIITHTQSKPSENMKLFL